VVCYKPFKRLFEFVCLVKRLKFGTTTGLLTNRSLIFDVLKAWYINWLLVRNPQAKKKEKPNFIDSGGEDPKLKNYQIRLV